MNAAFIAGLFLFAVCSAHAGGRTVNGFSLADATVPLRQIQQGGPPRDGIPALMNPRFLAAAEADFLAPDDRILGVYVDGEARAYPIRILNHHEVVNDRIGGRRFVVSYCPLCGTGMVFDAKADGEVLVFGVSGLLYSSDVLLYDRQSESLWSQVLMAAISGPRAGQKLQLLASRHTSWADWRTRHPRSKVLSTDTGHRRNYRRNPYRGYEKSRRLYFSVAHQAPRDRHPKEWVLGITRGGLHKAWPFSELQAGGKPIRRDRIGDEELVIHWDESAQSAWIVSPAGGELPSVMAYWFAWFAFHPDTAVFTADQ